MSSHAKGILTLIWERRTRIIIFAVIITISLLLFRGAISIKDNSAAIAANTEATKHNTESTKQLVQRLQVAVDDLKEDNAQQTRFIECLLTLNGRGNLAREEIRSQCEETVNATGGSSGIRTSPSANTNTPQFESPKQPQPPQSPTPPEEQNPPIATEDNDGIIVGLPLLPLIHIPSPF